MVCYAGDNVNDLCPGLAALSAGDLLCPRAGYALERLLKEREEGEVKARIVPWESGEEILEALKEKVEEIREK